MWIKKKKYDDLICYYEGTIASLQRELEWTKKDLETVHKKYATFKTVIEDEKKNRIYQAQQEVQELVHRKLIELKAKDSDVETLGKMTELWFRVWKPQIQMRHEFIGTQQTPIEACYTNNPPILSSIQHQFGKMP